VPQDLIDTFLDWTLLTPSPPIFRLWSAIGVVAGALERRVWCKALIKPTYPNLFILLVAAPGIGKGIIEDAAHLWRKSPALRLAPDSTTSASMLDSLSEANRVIHRDGAIAYEYHSLLVAAEEFGVFLPEHDMEFLNRLNKIFVNPPYIRVRRKYLKEEVHILNPQINILAGTQPGYLSSLLPEVAWVQGFTQRLLLVHAASGPAPRLFADDSPMEELENELTRGIGDLVEMSGQFRWTSGAEALITKWDESGGPPAPRHIRLSHYLRRRTQFMLKLMMVSSASRREDLIIREFDFERALSWLKVAETSMPDVFREMTQKSDGNLLRELLYALYDFYIKGGKKPVHRSKLLGFLSARAPSEKCHKLLDLAVDSDWITRVDIDYFVPKKDPGEIDA
jgi:hypothetical protein